MLESSFFSSSKHPLFSLCNYKISLLASNPSLFGIPRSIIINLNFYIQFTSSHLHFKFSLYFSTAIFPSFASSNINFTYTYSFFLIWWLIYISWSYLISLRIFMSIFILLKSWFKITKLKSLSSTIKILKSHKHILSFIF